MHAARWINQLAKQGWNIHLFSAFEGKLHPDFRNITVYYSAAWRAQKSNSNVRLRTLWPFLRGAAGLQSVSRRFPPQWRERAAWLARVIRWLKPDVLHTLEFQMSGYLTLQAKSFFRGSFPPWIATNWGSDIYLYGNLPEHTERIKGVLSNCDYYGCECQRDVELARAFGFKGQVLPVLPGAGGFDVERMRQFQQPGPTSARRLIALKGYQHWAGRSLVGLQAVQLCADLLKAKGYRVAVYLANEDVKIAAQRVAYLTGVPIEIIPPSCHESMLKLHGRARVSIGLSISDGLSTSALEAMVMGAFPIQSNTSCLNELVTDGETALLVPPEDPAAVAQAIKHALTDDALVDRAADINFKVTAARLSCSVINPQVVAIYKQIVAAQHLRET